MVTEADLRAAFEKVDREFGPRGPVLHPADFAWAVERGWIVDGVIRWDRVQADYIAAARARDIAHGIGGPC